MSQEIKNELDALAITILQKAAQDNTPLFERVDAFKAVCQYYGLLQKRPKGVAPDPEESGTSFEDFSASINGAGELHGGTPLRSGSGNA